MPFLDENIDFCRNRKISDSWNVHKNSHTFYAINYAIKLLIAISIKEKMFLFPIYILGASTTELSFESYLHASQIPPNGRVSNIFKNCRREMTWNFSRQNVKEQNGDDPSSDEKSVWAENGLDPNGFSIGNDKPETI